MCAQTAQAVFHPPQVKNGKFLKKFFFNILTTHNDKICYVKHVLDLLCVFFTLFGCWGGGGRLPRGQGHNLLMQFSSLGISKMEISETMFLIF